MDECLEPRYGKSKGVISGFFRFKPFNLGLSLLNSFYDSVRFTVHSSDHRMNPTSKEKCEALILLFNHRIEKSLTLPETGKVFGLDYVGRLVALLQTYYHLNGRNYNPVFWSGYVALREYRKIIGRKLDEKASSTAIAIDGFLHGHELPLDFKAAPTKKFHKAEMYSASRFDFRAFANQRRSIRSFEEKPIEASLISEAVSIALTTPSVCNRQSWRVRVLSEAQVIEQALKHQNGNYGFGNSADKLLLVTADLRSFVASCERNQPYIDGGMFCMNLIYALQSLGIASCCLNLSKYFWDDLVFRDKCDVPGHEALIMLLAIGYPPETCMAAQSSRFPVEQILSVPRN